MDPLILARLQFAANISFHILFPVISIALAWLLLYFKVKHARTGQSHWQAAYRLWVKIFALTFALGVVSGVTMSFQFGTNWPGYMEHVGNVAGPLLAYEVLTAFFLEATFLAVMLFGSTRVSNRMHMASIVLVAVGTSLSAYWILDAVSRAAHDAGFGPYRGVSGRRAVGMALASRRPRRGGEGHAGNRCAPCRSADSAADCSG
jgi:cytochrome d ubiquinol oxidase subunit I